MSLACAYDKWRRKQISWVGSPGRDKSGWICSLPLFSTGTNKKGAMNAAGEDEEREPHKAARKSVAENKVLVPVVLSKKGVI